MIGTELLKADPTQVMKERADQMILPKKSDDILRLLKVLRLILASSSLNTQELDQVWAEILSFSDNQIRVTEAMMSLAANVIRMGESSRRTYDLISVILRYGHDAHPGERCGLKEAIDEAVMLLAVKIRRTQAKLLIDVPEDLKVSMSRVELGQIIINLLHNALDYFNSESIDKSKRQITITHKTDHDGMVRIFVKNFGDIPNDIRAKIFDRGMTTKGEKGSGLGLYISKRIAQRAHGDLRLDESTGDETCFEVQFKQAG